MHDGASPFFKLCPEVAVSMVMSQWYHALTLSRQVNCFSYEMPRSPTALSSGEEELSSPFAPSPSLASLDERRSATPASTQARATQRSAPATSELGAANVVPLDSIASKSSV